MASRGKRYTGARTLLAAIESYFTSISRTVDAVERIETGEKEAGGKKVVLERKILSDNGEPIRYREYVVPPTIWGLCEHLGISASQWAAYCDARRYPEFREATERAKGYFREWNERELLTRKDVRGLIYHLQNLSGSSVWGGGEEAVSPLEGMSLSERRTALLQLHGEGGDDDGGD